MAWTDAAWWKTTKRLAGFAFELFRYAWSTALLLFTLSIVIYSMVYYKTSFYPGVPNWAQILLLFVFLFLLGTCEGTMIALTQLRKVDPMLYKEKYKLAFATVEYAKVGQRVERFLNGRQVIVVLCGFQLAYLTTTQAGSLPFLPGVFSALLETGLLGSFLVLILGQISPQIFAAKFPTVFLSIPFLPIVFRVCLLIEFTGITYATWAIIRAIIYLSGQTFKEDVQEPDAAEEEEMEDHHLALFEPLRALLTEHSKADAGAVEMNVIETVHDEKLPVLVGDDTLYASPAKLAEDIRKAGLYNLSFLEPPTSTNYVPAHIVAAALMAENDRLAALLAQRRQA